ncbi:MAG: glycosyltransferase family 4 protein [Deltaproteobacteria bacterium]|nr:glycosyltransferase family 4 protein [Deltaproteobacteria bacterium]
MKILLVNDYATPTGGAELLTLALRDGLRERGHEVRVFASSARLDGGDSFADTECLGTTSSWRVLLQAVNPWAFGRLRHLLAVFQPDIVHVGIFLTQLSPVILPLLREIPSVYQVHWYRPICPVGTKTLPDGSICRVPAGTVCYRNRCLPLRHLPSRMVQMTLWRHWRGVFKRIIVNSNAAKRRLEAEGFGPLEVLYPGVPTLPLRPPLSFPPTIAFAGRFMHQKGAEVLLRAFGKVVERVPQARLLLAGDGPDRQALDRLITALGVSSHVSLLGHLPRAEVEHHFASAWVQAVPSRFAESFGLVAVEAMMRGTAVVASASDGLTEIVRDGQTGFLVPPADAGALAEALVRILSNRELAERLGEAGREVALTHFRWETYLDKIVEVYLTISHRG